MSEPKRPLGKIVAVYGLSPAHLQRAVFITVLAFLFFLAMMFGFYIRQNYVYFILASAFLVVYILTLLSWILQRRTLLQIFENGVVYKKNSANWSEIADVQINGAIVLKDNEPIVISPAIHDFANALAMIRVKIDKS